MRAQGLYNAREQGLYFGNNMEMMRKQMNIEKTKDKVFHTLFHTIVHGLQGLLKDVGCATYIIFAQRTEIFKYPQAVGLGCG